MCACTHLHVCVNSPVRVEARGSLKCLLQVLTLFFETGSLRDFGHPEWPTSLWDPPLSASPSPWLYMATNLSSLSMDSGDWIRSSHRCPLSRPPALQLSLLSWCVSHTQRNAQISKHIAWCILKCQHPRNRSPVQRNLLLPSRKSLKPLQGFLGQLVLFSLF